MAGKNFGCGSSREHAAWALGEFGFRVILAPSFADIFRNNAGNNGLLVIELAEAVIQSIAEHAERIAPITCTSIWRTRPSPTISVCRRSFEIDAFRRHRLLQRSRRNRHDAGARGRHCALRSATSVGVPKPSRAI